MDSLKTPHSPHARVRVINISQYDVRMKNKEQQLLMRSPSHDDGCATPKKLPAKIISAFKKDPSKSKEDKKTTGFSPKSVKAQKAAAKVAEVTSDVLPIPMPNTNDEALSDFLNRVSHNKTQQKGEASSSKKLPPSNTSPATPAGFAMLPEYARYQEARFQRVISRGNSYSNMSATMSPAAPPTSPGVEWVDHRSIHHTPSSPSTSSSMMQLQHGWDAASMVTTRHAYPSNIFCARGAAAGEGPPSPAQAAALAAMHQEYGYPPYSPLSHSAPHHHHYHAPPSPAATAAAMAYHEYHQHHHHRGGIHRRSFADGSLNGSVPSAAAISHGSSSSWSEDEEQRHFMDYMAHASGQSSYAHAAHAAAHAAHQHPQHAYPPPHHSYQEILQRSASTEEQQPQPQQKLAPTPQEPLPLVEISPGVHEPLRKADETVHAVRHDFYVPVCCFGCSTDIFSIADAKYVICPQCRVVSPIEEGALDGQVMRQHGLGLGFTCESLFQIQSDILLEHRNTHNYSTLT